MIVPQPRRPTQSGRPTGPPSGALDTGLDLLFVFAVTEQTMFAGMRIDATHGDLRARKAGFAGVPWQRCQFHLQPNASP